MADKFRNLHQAGSALLLLPGSFNCSVFLCNLPFSTC